MDRIWTIQAAKHRFALILRSMILPAQKFQFTGAAPAKSSTFCVARAIRNPYFTLWPVSDDSGELLIMGLSCGTLLPVVMSEPVLRPAPLAWPVVPISLRLF
jgi:hypothetical protein